MHRAGAQVRLSGRWPERWLAARASGISPREVTFLAAAHARLGDTNRAVEILLDNLRAGTILGDPSAIGMISPGAAGRTEFSGLPG